MESGENLYFKARRDAAVQNERLYSRERAAELLGISASSLANYELGVTKTVPPDAVVMMADLYNAPELRCYYCANDCPIGRGTPLPTKVNSIELITIKAIKVLLPIEDVKSKLLHVSADGKLTKENLSTVMWLLAYLDDLSGTLVELRLACQKFLSAGGVNVKG